MGFGEYIFWHIDFPKLPELRAPEISSARGGSAVGSVSRPKIEPDLHERNAKSPGMVSGTGSSAGRFCASGAAFGFVFRQRSCLQTTAASCGATDLNCRPPSPPFHLPPTHKHTVPMSSHSSSIHRARIAEWLGGLGNRLEEEFARLDANGDGQITHEELLHSGLARSTCAATCDPHSAPCLDSDERARSFVDLCATDVPP